MPANEHHRRALEQERAQLLSQLESISRDEDAVTASQQGREQATDPAGGDGDQLSVERAGLRSMAARAQSRLDAVDAALAALDTYGSCEVCASTIPPERLEALPGVARCVSCAS